MLLNEWKMVNKEDGKSFHCFNFSINWLMHLGLIKNVRRFKIFSNILVLITIDLWSKLFERCHIRNPLTPEKSVWRPSWKNQFASHPLSLKSILKLWKTTYYFGNVIISINQKSIYLLLKERKTILKEK